MICKVIDLPQTGQATSLLAVNSSLIKNLCTRWRSATLTRVNTSAKSRSAGFACGLPASAPRASLLSRKTPWDIAS